MLDRGFTETDLRAMIHAAEGLRASSQAGRWVLATKHGSRAWRVVVEPGTIEKLLVVSTAFPDDTR